MTLGIVLGISFVLFALGLAVTLSRANGILILAGIELMLGAANLNFIAFWRFQPAGNEMTGVIFVIFSIAIAAAEAAVGLAIIILVHRHIRSAAVDDADQLKG